MNGTATDKIIVRRNSETFYGLNFLVQYRRKRGGDDWHNMAAFDVESMAEKYSADCNANENSPWEYQFVEIAENPS